MRVGSFIVSLLLTTACEPGSPAPVSPWALESPADPAAPPPLRVPLTAAPVVRTATATFTVTGLPWGARATFLASANTTAPGACPPGIAPTCVDIAQPWTSLGEAVANQDGVAKLVITAPATAPASFEVQAYAVDGAVVYLSGSALIAALPAAGDADGDGVQNAQEVAAGADPRAVDTDGDGVRDGAELAQGTDPALADTDDDGLSDGDEVARGSDPLRADTDGDGLPDGAEVYSWSTDPNDADSDHDGRGDAADVGATGLVINEVQPRNDATVAAPDGRFADWFELYNPTGSAIDLSRVTLQIGAVTWRATGTLGPRSYAWFFAEESVQAPTVAPFGLPQEGGLLILKLDGVEVDNLVWGAVEGDVSLARFPDGGTWALSTAPTPGGSNGGSPPASTDPSDALFDEDSASTVRIWLPPASRASLEVDPYTEVPASIEINGTAFPEVGVHIKGQIGSLRSLSEKAAFKVDLNAYAPHRYRGLEALTLNNMVQDPSFVHEALTYALFRAVGVAAPRTGYTWVYVDDELFGLYLNVESVDDTFLERWFGDGSGPMWEGAYGTDFNPGAVGSFEYDEGPLVEDRTPLNDVTAVLQSTPNLTNLRRLEQLVDLDQMLAEMAAEAVSNHWDGYYTANNYRVYKRPSDGRLVMIPWGTDQTWGGSLNVYGSAGDIFTWCVGIPQCRAMYDNQLWLAATAVGEIDLVSKLDRLAAFVGPNVPADARGHRDQGYFQGTVDGTRAVLQARPDEILTRLNLHCTGVNDPPACYLCDTVSFGLMCRQPVTWAMADQACRDFGQRLVQLRTAQANTTISNVTAPYGQHWIGLTDRATEGRYVWGTGQALTFSQWWSGEPNNYGGDEDCIGNNFGATGYWNDYSCNTSLPFACQP